MPNSIESNCTNVNTSISFAERQNSINNIATERARILYAYLNEQNQNSSHVDDFDNIDKNKIRNDILESDNQYLQYTSFDNKETRSFSK